jgi:triacylglycerol lipase
MNNESHTAPIVLVHGIFGFTRIALGNLKNVDYYREIPDALRKDDHVVPAPPQTHRTGSVAERAQDLKNYLLDPNRVEVFGKKVHLVAHSMGGLDSRVMISTLGMADRVLSLTTIATPHHGSPIANAVVKKTEPWLPQVLEKAGIDVRATADLTTEACEQRNQVVQDAPGVAYFSIAGQYKPRKKFLIFGPSTGVLGPTYDLIAKTEGDNDGVVSVQSAMMPGRPAWTHLDTWNGNMNHFREINWGANAAPTPFELADLSIVEKYRELVKRIKEWVAARG